MCEYAVGSGVTVKPAPGSFDGEYLRKILGDLPAVLIVFDGGPVGDGTSVTLDGTWMIYVVVGWQGQSEKERRRAANGAYALVTALTVRLHNANMAQIYYADDGSVVAQPIDDFGQIRVFDVSNEWDSDLDRAQLALYSIELQQNIALSLPDNDDLADWLRTTAPMDDRTPRPTRTSARSSTSRSDVLDCGCGGTDGNKVSPETRR